MKNIIKFLCFIFYSTSIFFLPNNKFIFIFMLINLTVIFISKASIIEISNSTLKIFPFILFTFIINCLLDDFINSFWIGIKLTIVCNITVVYANTITVIRNSRNNKIIMLSTKNI